MFSPAIYLQGLGVLVVAALCTWAISLWRRNVAVVDSLWSPMFVLAAFTYAHGALRTGPRSVLALVLVTVWALRLSLYITWRNWGHGEDRRYQAIRARNEPRFSIKSLYLVFGLQALLAWVISLPLLGALLNPGPLGVLDWAGAMLWLVGFAFEAGGDWQLARFKSAPANRGKVMDQGLWRFTRHPNYFGDFCIWWGLYLLAVSACADVDIVDARVRCHLAREGYRRTPASVCGIRETYQRIFPRRAEALRVNVDGGFPVRSSYYCAQIACAHGLLIEQHYPRRPADARRLGSP